MNRLTEVRGGEELLAQYGYDPNGRRVSKTLANGVSASYTYNRAGLMTRLENRQGETVVSAWDYEYDLSGKQRAKTDRDGLRTEYRYDMPGQLALERTVNADGQETGSIRYTYDGYGNRLSAKSTGYAQYSESYAYDITDRMVSRSRTEADETVETVYSYDLNGNLIRSESEGKATARSYNAFGEQMSYAREGLKLWYRYRPDGLRHSREKVGGGAQGVVTHLWDGQEIAAELSGSGTVSAVYSRGNGELICQQIGENRSYYLHNAHGDVTERLDENGTLLKRYRYDSFGNILNPAALGDPGEPLYVDQNPFGYCGEYLDRETQEIYLRARYYDSATGRFNCEDPKRDGANWYSYCGADPVNRTDPTGTSWLSKAWNSTKKWFSDNKDTLVKIAVGAVMVAATAVAIAATGGIAAGALVASYATSVIVGTVAGMATGAAIAAVSHRVTTGSWDGAGQAAIEGAAQGGADAFMSAGFTGAASVTSGAIINPSASVLSKSYVVKPINPKVNRPTPQISDHPIDPPTNKNQLRKAMGEPPFEGAQAHHGLPWHYRDEFAKVGLNVNDPELGAWVDKEHQIWSYAYDQMWKKFFQAYENPTAEQILDYYTKIRRFVLWGGGF